MQNNPKTHVKVVGVLHIVLGAFGLIGAMIAFAAIGLPTGIALWNGDVAAATGLGLIAVCVSGFIALLSIPSIIGGWAFMAQKRWARGLMIVLAVLELLHFPLGTALGAYTVWVLLQNPCQLFPPIAPPNQALSTSSI